MNFFNTSLWKSAFATYSLAEIESYYCVLCSFDLFCFEVNAIFYDLITFA